MYSIFGMCFVQALCNVLGFLLLHCDFEEEGGVDTAASAYLRPSTVSQGRALTLRNKRKIYSYHLIT